MKTLIWVVAALTVGAVIYYSAKVKPAPMPNSARARAAAGGTYRANTEVAFTAQQLQNIYSQPLTTPQG